MPRVFFLCWLTTSVVVSAAAATTQGATSGERLDVLLITVDTLRADAVGAYGNADAETPWMDRLARGGVRFARAHAHNVVTLPAHASILSGLHPFEHGVRDNSGFRFPGETATLATLLADAGYRTAAFVSAFPLASRFGLDRGFDLYEDSFLDAVARPAFLELERSGTETVSLAKSWLDAGSHAPSFCWVHLYEPHFPYSPPAALQGRYRDRPYHGEVAAADLALAPLLEPILAAGKEGRTLVVLTSDHGEALGEHGEATHGIFAYESTLRVPLMLYLPRRLAPRSVQASARHVDLLPTLLDLLGLPVPDGVAGRSLLPAILGETERDPQATTTTYFEALSPQLNRGWAPLYGVLREQWKYIDLPMPELYDLSEDPREERNLIAADRERAEMLREALLDLRRSDPGASPRGEDEETMRRLEALGYLSAGAQRVSRGYGAADDPKRLIVLDQAFREVAGLYARGQLAAALARSRELVRRRPGMRMALLDLAHLERASGNLEAAVEALQEAHVLQPADPATLALLGAYLTQADRAAEAVAVTEEHSQRRDPDLEVLLVRGLALARLGRWQPALEEIERARRLEPQNPKVAVHAGTVLLMGGRRQRARAAFEQALRWNPETASAHRSLGVLAAEEGRGDEALAHWRQALASDPGECASLLGFARGLWAAGRTEIARPLLELFVSSAPPSRFAEEIERVRDLISR